MSKSVRIREETYQQVIALMRPRETLPECLRRLLVEREAWEKKYTDLVKALSRIVIEEKK